MIAPSSNPRRILRNLTEDVRGTDEHSLLIKGYCRTFKRLANRWHTDGKITKEERAEIIATANHKAFNQWQPVIYVIPRAIVEQTGRLIQVGRPNRAAYGPEMQVVNLRRSEFDIINLGLI